MTTKFDHIRLSRAFRPIALSALKDAPGWEAYRLSKGLIGATEALTKPEIHQAFEALGLDLQALFDAHQGVDIANAIDDPDMKSGDLNVMAHSSETPPGDGFEGANVDDVIAELLAPASAHMTPHLASMMPGLIRPAIEAAVRGPRVVIQRELVDADGVLIAPPVPSVNVVGSCALHKAFGMAKSDCPQAFRWAWENIMIAICDCATAPAIDPDYIWQPDVLCQLASMDVGCMNAWTFGPAGIGKTVGAEQYAARLGRPFVRIPIERTTEPQELIGQEVPHNGAFRWSDGKLTRAFRIPHAVILIDEPSLLRSGTLAVIQTALDQRELHLVTGEVVRAAQGVFIIAGDNTAGSGDDSGRYVDTAPLSAAFMDRFAAKIEYGYLPVAKETLMLSNRARVDASVARIMVEYADKTRRNADSGKLTMGLTPRRLRAWADMVRIGVPSAVAFNSAIITGSAPEDREPLKQLATTSVDHARIDGIVRGTIDPNATTHEPKAQGGVSSIANRFPDNDDATA